MRGSLSWAPLAASLLLSGCAARCVLGPSDRVDLYPVSAAYVPESKTWDATVHGWIYAPETDPLVRGSLLLVRDAYVSDPSADFTLFDRRAERVLVRPQKGRIVWIEIGGKFHKAGRTGDDGHFFGRVRLSEAEARGLGAPGGTALYHVPSCAANAASSEGRVQFLPAEGLSVIAGIDNTIRRENDRFAQTEMTGLLFRPYEPVAGMPEAFAAWKKRGASFHYLSAAPWQFFGPLEEFLNEAGFPAGDLILRTWTSAGAGILDRMQALAEVLRSSEADHTRTEAGRLLERYPQRRFVLVGDSGGDDPEVFGALARRYPGRVVKIVIRRVPVDGEAPDRFTKAFRDLSADSWTLVTTPAETAAAAN